jgi:hypothetical protein
MKKKKLQLIILFIGILFISGSVKAQSYQTALGLRFGGLTSGLTIKHFISTTSALEGIVSLGNQSFIVTGLYEMHSSVDNSKDFKFYYGAGGHVGFFQDGGSYYYNHGRLYTSTAVVGVDGILGLEYKFRNAPINVSMDLKPFVDFFNGGFVYFDGGISVRYTF